MQLLPCTHRCCHPHLHRCCCKALCSCLHAAVLPGPIRPVLGLLAAAGTRCTSAAGGLLLAPPLGVLAWCNKLGACTRRAGPGHAAMLGAQTPTCRPPSGATACLTWGGLPREWQVAWRSTDAQGVCAARQPKRQRRLHTHDGGGICTHGMQRTQQASVSALVWWYVPKRMPHLAGAARAVQSRQCLRSPPLALSRRPA